MEIDRQCHMFYDFMFLVDFLCCHICISIRGMSCCCTQLVCMALYIDWLALGKNILMIRLYKLTCVPDVDTWYLSSWRLQWCVAVCTFI